MKTGIITFGVLQVVFSAYKIFSSIAGLILMFIGILASGSTSNTSDQLAAFLQFLPYSIVIGIISIATGIIGLIAAIGLFRLKSWGRKTLSILSIIMIFVNLAIIVVTAIRFGNFSIIGAVFYVLSTVYYTLFLWYFNKKEVKADFK